MRWTTPLGLPVVQPYRQLGRHLVCSNKILEHENMSYVLLLLLIELQAHAKALFLYMSRLLGLLPILLINMNLFTNKKIKNSKQIQRQFLRCHLNCWILNAD